jgi:PAS domain S-box-containing protein
MLQSLDRAGYLLDVNLKWLEVMGYTKEQVIGRRIDTLMTAESSQDLIEHTIPRLRREGSVQDVRGQYVRADGSVIDVEASAVTIMDENGKPINLTVLNDVTERCRIEERERSLHAQLVQAQKMEAVGQMAGGLAHEFNNLLTAIIGNLSLIELEGPESPAFPMYLRDVTDAAQRSADLTRQLLLFSRKTAGSFNSVNLRELAQQAFKLARHSMPVGVELELDVDEDCPNVRGDATLLHQVLMNLILNARDACGSAGKITVRARSEEPGVPNEGVSPGTAEQVVVEVADTGEGMSPEVLERIFEPFFTTKAVHGTGLGLAVVYRIIQQHDGWITVDSQPGRGTRFSIVLPVNHEAATVAGQHAPVANGSGQHVLVVDDDALVLQLLTSTLANHGYRVTAVDDSRDACTVLGDGEVDLLLADVQLAGEDGFALLRRARAGDPKIPGLLTSGNVFATQAEDELTSIGSNAAFMAKPFRADELLHAVARLLQVV